MPAKFKHLIEEAKAETFKGMEDGELRDFRFRFVQLFERFFHDPATDQIRGMAKGDFLSRYVELRIEMTRRGLPIPGEREIDRLVKDRVVRKGLWSLDVPGLGDVVLADDYVAITGDFIKDPREATAVQVVIKAGRTDRGIFYSPGVLEACLAKVLQETGKEIRIAYEHAGCGESHMPVFDLVLRPKPTNKIVPGGWKIGKAEFGIAFEEEIEKTLTPAQQAEIDAESAVIRESAKTARAQGIHKFEPAKWTHPNGHPRCIICGDEEPIGGICNKTLPKAEADKQFEHWYQTGEWLVKGGAGSGNFGHAGGEGGPGNPGGSASSLGISDIYHGTSRLALESIISEGIKPNQGKNFKGALYHGDREGAVFLTTSASQALWYAKQAAEADGANEVAVIKVHIPGGMKLAVDREDFGPGKSFYTHQAIKAGWISGAKIIDVRSGESRTISLKADEGTPDTGDIYVVLLIRNDPDPEGGIAKDDESNSQSGADLEKGEPGEDILGDNIQTEKGEAPMDTKENIELMKETAFRDRLRTEKAVREAVAKPETSLTLRRIPVRAIPAGHEIRTIVLSEAQGIKALEDVTDHQISTYLFDKTKWTMEAAQAWVDSHIKKRSLPAAALVADLIEEEAAWADGAIEARKTAKLEKFEARTTDAYVRVRITDPADFSQGSFRTLEISADLGIKAVIGNLIADNSGATHIQAYLFDKDKWTEAKAKTWAESHAPKPFGKGGSGVIGYHDYGTAPEGEAWDAGAEVAAADVETLRKICAWADPAAPENKGSYKLPHHHASGLKAVWKGVAAAMAALQGGRGGINVPPADREGIYNHLKSHYGEFEKEPPVFKADPEPTAKAAWFGKRLIFQIRKVDAAQQICGGIIYEPNATDTQGDMTTAAEITTAMYSFMERYAKNPNRIKVMHKGKAFYFPILECFQPEADMKKGTEIIKAGSWWMMIKVTDAEIWSDVASGKLTGFSMGGTARKASAVWAKKAN